MAEQPFSERVAALRPSAEGLREYLREPTGTLTRAEGLWLLDQLAEAQEREQRLRAGIHNFNREWYNGGYCVLCSEEMNSHSKDCPMLEEETL